MSLRLGGKRGYWIVLGAGALVMLLVLFLWVIPAHSAAVAAQKEWDDKVAGLEQLQQRVNEKKIPSKTSLESIRDYREWLKKQDQEVRTFFADRASILEEPITGQGEPNPVDFKVKYIQAIKTQMEGLTRLKFSDPKNAFPAYGWMEGVGVPTREDFTPVLRGYWTRRILYNNIFLDPTVQVQLVKKLQVGALVSLTPDGDVALPGETRLGPFDALPFSMDVTLAPENVTKLIEKLLAVSPTISDRPVINLTRMSLSLEPPLCGLQLDGNILLIRRNPGESRAEPVKKAEAPKP